MEQSNKILIGIFIIILILGMFNQRINSLKQDFDTYCVVQYNISLPCPCMHAVAHKNSLNYDINLSLFGQFLDTENSSAS